MVRRDHLHSVKGDDPFPGPAWRGGEWIVKFLALGCRMSCPMAQGGQVHWGVGLAASVSGFQVADVRCSLTV